MTIAFIENFFHNNKYIKMAEYPIQGSDPIRKYYENFEQYLSELGIQITRRIESICSNLELTSL